MKLEKFIYKRLKNNNTSLGDNPAFPPTNDFPFAYKVIKSRYNEIVEKIQNVSGLKNLEIDYLATYLSHLTRECKELEKPIKHELEIICENIVSDVLKVPNGTVKFNIKLVDKLENKNRLNIMPEDGYDDFEFNDIQDFKDSSGSIMKRRFINSLIQGASYDLSKKYDYAIEEIYNVNPKLVENYRKIRIINDYLLFKKEENITDKNPMQGSYVETVLGRKGELSEINVQGIIFPYLLQETFRGMFELFSSHGLPSDNKKALFIIKQADFILAEPWDMRFGVSLWKKVKGDISDSFILPYYFSNLCELSVSEFNETMQEILSNTKKGKEIRNSVLEQSIKEYDMADLMSNISQKNISSDNIISDSYIPNDDINFYLELDK